MALLFISLTEPNSDVFLKNPDGSQYLGQVWPGYTVRYESRSRDAVRSHIEQFFAGFPGLVREQYPVVLDRRFAKLVPIRRQLFGHMARHERALLVLYRLMVSLR